MKTVIEIEATKGKQIKYRNISRIMYGINDRYGNDITVKFKADGTHSCTFNDSGRSVYEVNDKK